ncbi:MAG TPA: SMP-30/gluconolactonase/LRE family protein [Gaiellaceae bacterium]|nr:SMP-30/gluconolactonase/LRE family protein [Gaiellaceae bacterium]
MEVAIRAQALLGEGPRWDAAARRLLWVDIEARLLHVFDPDSGGDRAVELPTRVGVAAPTESGPVLAGLEDRLALVDLGDGSVSDLVRVPHGEGMRLNDGACDPAGRFWVGSMALDFAPGAGSLYRYAAGGALERVLDGVTVSNGIGWSPDGGLMYYVDTPTRRVDVFDFDVASGEISGRRPFVALERGSGLPDGLAVDEEGGVWVALWGGWSVRRYGPDGALARVVDVPAKHVTACCFGGDDGRSLYVTTASVELDPEQRREQPLAGSVFVTDAGVAGPPARPFAG